MKIYRVKVPEIAHEVIEQLTVQEALEVTVQNRPEAELDLVAIMEEYVRRDMSLRESVREHMSNHSVPYDQYGRVRAQMAEDWRHPTGDDVERFLARQFMEIFMMSRFVEEVYAEDKELYKMVVGILRTFHVDERALRDEAREQIRNIPEGTVDYEIALSKALREVKKRHGLIQAPIRT
jgi:hypothetical protein